MPDRFCAILDELKALHNLKSQDYGSNEDPYANVRGSESWGIPGWLGAMVRANDKIKRLQSFAVNHRLANEGVEDAFKDLAVYAVIALILYEESRDAKAIDTAVVDLGSAGPGVGSDEFYAKYLTASADRRSGQAANHSDSARRPDELGVANQAQGA